MAPNIELVLDHAQTVVIGNKDPDFADVPKRLREGQQLVDFVRIGNQRSGDGKYEGICW
jgi:GDP-mannose 6-dehydrogenase